MKQTIEAIKLLSVFFLVLTFLGCEDDDTVLPAVEAGFTFTLDQNTGTVTFINTSTNANNFAWNFGDGTSSEEINPTKIYTANGTFTVVLTASSVAGASGTFEDELTINIPEEVGFPINFDVANVDYSTITTFDTAFQIIENPELSGTNPTASLVGEIVSNGISFQGVTFPLETPIDFSGADKTITLKLYATVATDILVKFSGGIDGARDVEVVAAHSGSGWEDMTFNFATDGVKSFVQDDPENGQAFVPDGQYGNLDLFVGFGADPGISSTFYIDDIVQTEPNSNGGGNMGGSLVACDGGELINDLESSDDTIFSNFGGGVGTVIDNPDTSVNMSAKVGQYVKNTGELFGGITIALDSNIDLNNGVFSIDVYSQTVRQLLFKLEGLDVESTTPTSGTGWETLEYDFNGNMGAVTAITLIMDNGTAGDGSADWTIQFDNIRLCSNDSTGGGSSLVACDGGELINDLESSDDSIFSNFGGGVGTVIDNPDTSVNMSAKVGQYVKNAGELFGGITIALDSNIDLNNGVFSIDVYSQTVRQLLFKLEGLDVELTTPTSGTGWETLEYDFNGNMGAVTAITLIMDNGTAGDGSADWTIQFDNIRLCSNGSTGGGSSLVACDGGELINDLESSDDSIFSNFGGGVGTVIDNPDTSVNMSAKVGQYVKNAGELFGGITIALDSNIDLNNGVFSIDVYSQTVRQLLFKLEGLDVELTTPTSGTGWETLEYDFNGNMGAVTAITLIMDNGTAGDGSADWTIQFDNIRLCSNGSTGGSGTPGGLASNGDFETGDDTGWMLFQNGGTAALDNTLNNGGSWSGRLTVGDTGGNPAFKQERIGAGTVAAGDVVQIQFDHIGSIVQPGAAVNVVLFGESPGGVTFTEVLTPAPVLGGTWSTFTGTYTIPGGTDVSEGISFLIETVCGAVTGCSVTMNIDNVSVTLNP